MKELDQINWDDVIAQAKARLTFIESPNYHGDTDDKQYIYEAVMEAVYGDNIWDHINSQLND